MRNKNVVVNIASDGLEAAIIKDVSASETVYRDNVSWYIGEFLEETVCGRMFFNVCYKRSVVHSNVADTCLYNVGYDKNGNVVKTEVEPCNTSPLNKKFREMLKRDIDIVRMAVDECRRRGAEAWLSVRMNDHHYPDDRNFNSVIGYERAEELGVNGSRTYLDFTKNEVQNYYKAYIEELCRNYDIDGIELDFLRSCPVMSCVNDENIGEINSFVREIKEIVERVKPECGLAVRVYPTEERNLGFGLDAAQWIADGCADIITVENWYIPTWYDIPVEKWRESIDSRNVNKNPYTLLCGTDWAVSCDRTPYYVRDMWLSLEQFRGFASGAYTRGADGIYIFNHFNVDDDYNGFHNLGLYSCYIDEKGNKIEKRVIKDKINSANSRVDSEKGMRTYVNTYSQNTPYPVKTEVEQGFEFMLNTGSAPKCGYYNVVVGVDDTESTEPVQVSVNGCIAEKIEDVPKVKDFEYKKSDTEWTYIDHVSETAPRVMQFSADIKAVKDGFNRIEIAAKNKPQIIRWIEIQTEEK